MQKWEYKVVQFLFYGRATVTKIFLDPPTIVFENGRKIAELPWTLKITKDQNDHQITLFPPNTLNFSHGSARTDGK